MELNRKTDHVSEDDQPTKSQLPTTCPECQGQIIPDEVHGETRCEDCGLVFDEGTIDHGPEWRTFDADERGEKSRVGAPTTQLLHDHGLSTTISWQNKDAYGNTLSEQKRSRIQRLRKWDERFRTKDGQERNIKRALNEIERMASALGLPRPIRESAGVIYRRAVEEDLLPGRSIEGVATASLYAASRQHGTPRPLPKFASVSRIEKLRFQRTYRYLIRELGLQIMPEDPATYVPQFASSVDISDEAEHMARKILDVAKANAVHSGKRPSALAAAALYAAAKLTNEQLTQQTISDATQISKVTIRKRYQELLDVYAEQQWQS